MRGILVVKANQLSIEMRPLHHVIGWILVPKTAQFDFMEIELMLMVALVRRTTMNMPDIIFHQTQEVMSSRRLSSLSDGFDMKI